MEDCVKDLMDKYFTMMNMPITEREVGDDTVDEYTINTCFTADAGYETAVCFRNNVRNFIVVGNYANRDEAVEGHKKWVDYCKANHPTELYSVQDGEIERL